MPNDPSTPSHTPVPKSFIAQMIDNQNELVAGVARIGTKVDGLSEHVIPRLEGIAVDSRNHVIKTSRDQTRAISELQSEVSTMHGEFRSQSESVLELQSKVGGMCDGCSPSKALPKIWKRIWGGVVAVVLLVGGPALWMWRTQGVHGQQITTDQGVLTENRTRIIKLEDARLQELQKINQRLSAIPDQVSEGVKAAAPPEQPPLEVIKEAVRNSTLSQPEKAQIDMFVKRAEVREKRNGVTKHFAPAHSP